MGQTKAIIASYLGVLLFAALVFIGAGKVVYWQGALYVALALFGATLSHMLMPAGSTLTADRAREAPAGQAWDKRLLGAYFLVNIVVFLVAGLDSGRFHWSGDVPMGVTVGGAGLMLAGQVLFAVSKRANAHFSSTVRILEHGHEVCESGPYKFVRHPGYLGMLGLLLAFPLVMNSYVAFVPAMIGAGVLVARTIIEDRFLLEHLPGYTAYASRTRWKLLPGLF